VLIGPGVSFGGQNVDGGAVYRHVGPIGPGLLLERLEVIAVVGGTSVVFFSSVLTASPTEDEATFRSGSALIGRSGATQNGKPAFGGSMTGAVVWRFVIPLGFRVGGGANFLLCAMSSTTGGIQVHWSVVLFTLRLEKKDLEIVIE